MHDRKPAAGRQHGIVFGDWDVTFARARVPRAGVVRRGRDYRRPRGWPLPVPRHTQLAFDDQLLVAVADTVNLARASAAAAHHDVRL